MPSYVVTGASRGIGLEYVQQLTAVAENKVFALVRNKTTAHATLSLLQKNHSNLYVLEADITDHKALKAAAAEVAELTGGSLDVLVNNAAMVNNENEWRSILDYEGEESLLEQEFNDFFKVNVIGVIHSTNSFIPLLRRGTTKKVITIGSLGGDVDFIVKTGFGLLTPYCTSKAATNMIVAKYAVKLKDEGFICITVDPGNVDTSATAVKKRSAKNKEWTENASKVYSDIPELVTPKTSVEKQLKLISEVTIGDTGRFLRA